MTRGVTLLHATIVDHRQQEFPEFGIRLGAGVDGRIDPIRIRHADAVYDLRP